jgi:Family of unknown function (DUF5995)
VAPRSDDRESFSPAAGGERWAAIAGALSGPVDPRSPNACNRGEQRCIDDIVSEMTRRYEALASACDHRAAFAFMYLRVTEAVGTRRSVFREPTYLNHLDAVFAQLYFSPFDAYAAGKLDRVPIAWRVAFQTAERRQVSALGDMLLGMNAHISRDLPFALAEVGLRDAEGRSAKRDFDRVNGLLRDVQQPMLDAVARRLDPAVKEFSVPAFGFSYQDVAELLGAWRSEAWRNAAALIEARTPAQRAAVTRRIETNAETRARLLQIATSYALLGGSTAERDRFCDSRSGRTDPRSEP